MPDMPSAWPVVPAVVRSRARALSPGVEHRHHPLEEARPFRGVGEPGWLVLASSTLHEDRLADAELPQTLGTAVPRADAALLHAAEGKSRNACRDQAVVDAGVAAFEPPCQRDTALHVARP